MTWWKTFLSGLGKFLGLVADKVEEADRAERIGKEQARSNSIDADPPAAFDGMFGGNSAEGDGDTTDADKPV